MTQTMATHPAILRPRLPGGGAKGRASAPTIEVGTCNSEPKTNV